MGESRLQTGFILSFSTWSSRCTNKRRLMWPGPYHYMCNYMGCSPMANSMVMANIQLSATMTHASLSVSVCTMLVCRCLVMPCEPTFLVPCKNTWSVGRVLAASWNVHVVAPVNVWDICSSQSALQACILLIQMDPNHGIISQEHKVDYSVAG